jgi:hypothetical protein
VVWTGSRSRASILFRFVQSLPEELATALERHRRTFLLLFSLAYLASIGIVASRRPLWADEVLTAYMTRLGWRQLWPALASGVDLEPPLFHLITRAFTSVLGPTPLALRMPAIVGGWLMSISLFHFVSRRRPVLYAAIAMLIPFVTGFMHYTYEARCYGIALGFAALALLCWQGAVERRRRGLCLMGLALSLAAAVACQYYMLLVFLTIAGGEAVRTFPKRHMDRSIWLALAVSLLPLPFHIPLIRAAMTFSGGAWSAASVASLVNAYEGSLGPAILAVALILTGLALWEHLGSDPPRPLNFADSGTGPAPTSLSGERVQSRTASMRSVEASWETVTAALLGFGFVGAFVLARLTNGVFTPRYGVCVVLGAAILPLFALRAYDAGRPVAGALTFLVLLASAAFAIHQVGDRKFQTPNLLQNADNSAAIVIENPLDFMELIYNAPPQLVSRLYYLPSTENAKRYTGTDDDDRELLLLKKWFRIQRVEDPGAFMKHNARFLIWRGGKDPGWLLRKVSSNGATVTLISSLAGEWLFSAAPQR